MAGHTAITEVSDAIVERLREGVTARDAVAVEPDEIVLASPDDVSDAPGVRLSVFPYRVSRESRSGSQGRVQTGENTFRGAPMVLSAYYLVTAYADGGADAATRVQDQQSALGLAMQLLHDNSSLEGHVPEYLEGSESPGVRMHSEANEEIERVWNTFVDASLRPSVVYEAGPIYIESTREEEVSRVAERDVDVDRRRDR